MGIAGLRRAWSRLAGQASRITGLSTPFGGVQFRPSADNSFGRAQGERELMDKNLASGRIAKPAARRMPPDACRRCRDYHGFR